MKKLLTIGALLLLGACAAPAISDISTDKVKIESDLDDLQGATAQANHGCALYKRVPVFLSKRIARTGPYTQKYEYLFACMAPGAATSRSSADAHDRRSRSPPA